LTSVTTILGETQDKTALDNWRNRIGHAEADFITKTSAGIGTCMHNNLEAHLAGTDRPIGNSPVREAGRKLADVIIQEGLCHVSEVWGLEKRLYYPGLYAGTADVIGIFKNKESIMDFKNTRRPKKPEWVQSYYQQVTAYALAHNEVHGTNITHGVIFMVAREESCFGIYQEFEIDTKQWIEPWLQSVEKFYANS